METMRAIVLVTCVISILSGLLDVLKPSAKFDRQLRLLLASVFVLGIFTPLSRGAAEFQPNWDCAAELTDNSSAELDILMPYHYVWSARVIKEFSSCDFKTT